jgi:hypothetical protein
MHHIMCCCRVVCSAQGYQPPLFGNFGKDAKGT